MHVRFSLLAVIVLLLSASTASTQNLSTLDTPLAKPDGGESSVAALGQDRVTVVSFWATWCKPCKEEMKAVSGMYDELREMGAEYIAVSVDNTKTMARVDPYIKSQGYEFPVLLDPNSELFNTMNGTEVPYTLVFDASGELRFKHDGYLEGDEVRLREEIESLLAETAAE